MSSLPTIPACGDSERMVESGGREKRFGGVGDGHFGCGQTCSFCFPSSLGEETTKAERWPEVCICSLRGHHGGERQATGLPLQDKVGAGCNKQGFSVSAEPML